MNKLQLFALRALTATMLASILLLVFYNLQPVTLDETGMLQEAFWALGLASFGLVFSVFGFLVLLIWLRVSASRRRNGKA